MKLIACIDSFPVLFTALIAVFLCRLDRSQSVLSESTYCIDNTPDRIFDGVGGLSGGGVCALFTLISPVTQRPSTLILDIVTDDQ
jgi:hypothetical protein